MQRHPQIKGHFLFTSRHFRRLSLFNSIPTEGLALFLQWPRQILASCLRVLGAIFLILALASPASAAPSCELVWKTPADALLAEFVQMLKLSKLAPQAVNRTEMIDLQKLNVSGENHQAFYKAKYRGRTVAIKWMKADDAGSNFFKDTLHWEYSMLKILESLALGPKVHGFIIENGKPVALVMDYVEGSFHNWAQEIRSLDPAVEKQMLNIFNKLEDVGIVPMDLQFILTQQGQIVVIDPGLFFWKSADAPDFPLKAARKQRKL